jgi:hypothetical protein
MKITGPTEEFKIRKRYGDANIIVHSLYHPDLRARLAMQIVDHMSMVAGAPDGEDSAGRHKLKLLPPADCAERACAIADEMVTQFERRDWLLKAPSMEELEREPEPAEV